MTESEFGFSKGREQYQVVADHEGARTVMIRLADGTPELHAVKNEPPEIKHTFRTLEGFTSFLNSEDCKDYKGIIFVGDDTVCVNLDYPKSRRKHAWLSLLPTPELQALKMLADGVTRDELFKALATDLYGVFSPNLALLVQKLSVTVTSKSGVEISSLGVKSGASSSMTKITYTKSDGAKDHTEIPEDWLAQLPIWQCFDSYQADVSVRLMLDNDLVFTLAPRQLHRVMRSAKLALVARLTNEVPDRFTVYEGIEFTQVLRPAPGHPASVVGRHSDLAVSTPAASGAPETSASQCKTRGAP